VLRVAAPAANDVSARFHAFLNAQLGKPYDFESHRGIRARPRLAQSRLLVLPGTFAAALQAAGRFAHPLAKATKSITPSDLLPLPSAPAAVGQPTENP
jgi:hypothetical protein